MKKYSRFLLILMLPLVFVTCRPYPDGPVITVLPKVTRLSHNWKTVKVLKNGVDITSAALADIAKESFNISANKTFSYESTSKSTGGLLAYTGSWAWNDDKTDVTFSWVFGPNYINRICVILKLEEKAFWEQEVNTAGDLIEYHYEPN